MYRTSKLILAFLLICVPAFAEVDVLPSLSTPHDLVVANENMRQLDARIRTLVNEVPSISLTSEVTGTLPVANGGTGQVTAQAAIDSLTVASGGTADAVWTTNGTNGVWVTQVPLLPYVDGTIYEGTTAFPTTPITVAAAYAKKAEIIAVRPGTITAYYVVSSVGYVYYKIYVNDIAVGAENNVQTIAPYTDLITVKAGDKIQLWAKQNTGDPGTIWDFRIKCGNPTVPSGDKLHSTFTGGGVPPAGLGTQGDIYIRLDGGATTTLYVKTAPTTWTAK